MQLLFSHHMHAVSIRSLVRLPDPAGAVRLPTDGKLPSPRATKLHLRRNNTASLQTPNPDRPVPIHAKRSWRQSFGQSLNFAGVRLFLHIRGGHEELAIPHVSVPDIRHVNWAAIRAAGFQGCAFDKDGTLTLPYAESVYPVIQESLDQCRAAFDGNIALFSNSAGLYQYDPTGEVADKLERELGIAVLRHSEKKPAGGTADLESFFGCPAEQLVMVGDRFFTDIVYGNKNGMLTVHSAALSTEGEPTTVGLARRIEERYISQWRKRGVQPPRHALVQSEEVLACFTSLGARNVTV